MRDNILYWLSFSIIERMERLRVLECIWKGIDTIYSISRETGYSTSSIKRYLEELTASGLIYPEYVSRPHNAIKWKITREGRKLLEFVWRYLMENDTVNLSEIQSLIDSTTIMKGLTSHILEAKPKRLGPLNWDMLLRVDPEIEPLLPIPKDILLEILCNHPILYLLYRGKLVETILAKLILNLRHCIHTNLVQCKLIT